MFLGSDFAISDRYDYAIEFVEALEQSFSITLYIPGAELRKAWPTIIKESDIVPSSGNSGIRHYFAVPACAENC